MKLPKIYQGEKITGRFDMAACELDMLKQIVEENKVGYGIAVLRGCYDTLFMGTQLRAVHPELSIRRGSVAAYRKNNNNETYIAFDEYFFIADGKGNIYGKITIDKTKKAKVDLFFDPVKEHKVIDLREKGAMSSCNIEETLHYTDKKAFTTFFKNIDVSDKRDKASEI